MKDSKKELVLAAMDNKVTARVPVGFWFHFLQDEVGSNAFENPELTDTVLQSETRYIETTKPDFVKIMSDGFFPYENKTAAHLRCAADFKKITPLPDDSPWFTQQIEYVKKLTSRYGQDLAMFYNVFSAGTTVKFMYPDEPGREKFLADAVMEDPSAVRQGLDVISADLAKLVKRVIAEGGATGIYFSVQNLLGPGITKDVYDHTLAPGEKAVLAAANSASPYNILHICGYAGHRNDLSWYADYDVKTINWAAVVEGIPLEEGRKIFSGRAALGGFGNLNTEVLYTGTKEEIQEETKRILAHAGRQGIILGADCTVPRDTNWEHFEWVREAAKV